jgi:type I restriction enzyme S subunit
MSNGWQTQSLEELVSFSSGGTPSKSNAQYWGGEFPWITAKDLKRPVLIDSKDCLTKAGTEAAKVTSKDSLLILVRGMTLFKDVPVCLAGRDMAFNQDIKALVVCDDVDPKYLQTYLISRKSEMLRLVDSAGHGTGRMSMDILREFPVMLPSLPEQKAIADLLATWDEAIEKTERLIQAKERRFKWLLRELISEPRNTQKGERWEMVKLGEVCKIASKEKLSSVDGHFLLTVKLHCLGIERNDRIAPTLTERGRPYYEHKSGDFLIGRQNFHNGGFGIIAPELDGGITSNAISCLIVNKSKLSKVFLWFQFANPNYYKKVGHVMDGTGQKELSDKQILKLKICLPDLETQNQIAEILSSAQHEIVLLKQLAEQYKAQKRGLMQKMLTGEWRVKPEVVKSYE